MRDKRVQVSRTDLESVLDRLAAVDDGSLSSITNDLGELLMVGRITAREGY